MSSSELTRDRVAQLIDGSHFLPRLHREQLPRHEIIPARRQYFFKKVLPASVAVLCSALYGTLQNVRLLNQTILLPTSVIG